MNTMITCWGAVLVIAIVTFYAAYGFLALCNRVSGNHTKRGIVQGCELVMSMSGFSFVLAGMAVAITIFG